MEKDLKLEKLCEEFVALEAGERDYILGISKALAFSVERQGLALGNPELSLQEQGREPQGGKAR
jgi:hypothetical protein